MATKIPILFEIMSQRKITQKKLGANIGVSEGNISDWKSGRAAPSIEVLPKIANYLNCSVDCLLGRADRPTIEVEKDLQKIIDIYSNLNDERKRKLFEYANDLSELEKYEKDTNIKYAYRVARTK